MVLKVTVGLSRNIKNVTYSTLVNVLTQWVAYTHIFHLIGYSNSHCIFKNVKRMLNWVGKMEFLIG